MPFSKAPDLSADALPLASLAAKYCRLPHPEVVRRAPAAIFPTIRDQKNRGRLHDDGALYLDDNVTPRWALFWAHGIKQTHHPKGWTIAHVWGAPKDPDAYTNLANLVLMPEALASLSDKNGPLCAYLQFHAQTVYSWKPRDFDEAPMPIGYDCVSWRYFDPYDAPTVFISERLKALDNQRTRAFRPLMGV